MPALIVYTPTLSTPRPVHPKAKISTDGGLSIVLPFAPNEVEHGGIADVFSTLDRPGRKPLVTRTAEGLRVTSFEVLLARPDHQASVEDYISLLHRIGRSGDRITLSLSALETGIVWRMTDLSISTRQRQHGTNAVTRATASLAFEEAVDAVVNVGPLSGGTKTKRRRVRRTTHYVVKKGDRISRIALRFYGDPNGWHRIAKASKLKHPHKLKPGRRLTIPPN